MFRRVLFSAFGADVSLLQYLPFQRNKAKASPLLKLYLIMQWSKAVVIETTRAPRLQFTVSLTVLTRKTGATLIAVSTTSDNTLTCLSSLASSLNLSIRRQRDSKNGELNERNRSIRLNLNLGDSRPHFLGVKVASQQLQKKKETKEEVSSVKTPHIYKFRLSNQPKENPSRKENLIR